MKQLRNESYVPGFTYTEADALWAVSMVKSRSFGFENGLIVGQTLPDPAKNPRYCMLPIGAKTHYARVGVGHCALFSWSVHANPAF